MKKLLCLLPLLAALLVHAPAHAQMAPVYVYCNTSIASYCTPTTNPGNGAQGDLAWQAFGKLNVNFRFIAPLWALPPNSVPCNSTSASGELDVCTAGTNVTIAGGVISFTGGGGGGGTGTVTSLSVTPANGFAGTVATATTTPAITIYTSISGPLKGNGSAMQAATAADIYSLFGCTGSATQFPNGAGGCTTPSGGGSLSPSGSPAQYYVGVFSSGTTIGGIAPSSTVGQAFVSNGVSANPGYSSSLPGVTSVNGTTICSACTLLSAGGGLGTPSSGVATNLTGTAAALNIGGNAATATLATTATNLAGGAANSVPYQTGTGATSAFSLGTNTLAGNSGSGPAGLTAAQAIGVLNFGTTCNAQTGTSYTAAIGDANSCITTNNASANTGTIPPHSSVAFLAKTVLTWQQLGAGITTIGPGSGVTICSLQYGCSTSQTYTLCGPYDSFQLQQSTTTDTWLVTQPACLATLNTPQILVNTGVNLRIQTAASGTSFTPTVGTADQVDQANTASAGTLTVNNPTGTPSDGQRLTIRITSTNVQTFSWGTAYHGGTTALPTATTGSSKHDYFGFIYDAATSQWDYIATVAGF